MWAKPTLLRKQFEARLRFRHQRTERAPHRLAYAVMIPLIRRYRQQRGPVPEQHRVPENDFDFWIHWLHWFSLAAIPEAAGFLKANDCIERTLREPLQRLIQALADCRDGVRSRYTESFWVKPGKLGRDPDVEEIKRHKVAIGTAYRVLSSVALCSQARAIAIVQRRLRRLGYVETPAHAIPQYARKVPDQAFSNGCNMFISCIFNFEDNPLLQTFPRSQAYGCIDALRENHNLWRRLVMHYARGLKERPPSEKQKILRFWAMRIDLTINFILRGLYGVRELERFHGYVRQDRKTAPRKSFPSASANR